MTDEDSPIPSPAPAVPPEPQDQAPPAVPRRRRPTRLVASLTATAVLAFGAGAGVGAAAWSGDDGAASGGSAATTAPTLQWSYPDGADGADGTAPGWAAPDAGLPATPDPYAEDGSATGSPDTTTATAEQESGLVLISSTLQFGAGESAGTGMVLTGDGLVVTNHHVVEGATAIEVTVASTGESYQAEVLGTDATHDVAVLRLQDASGLTAVSTDTSGVTAGQAVTAVGDAGGDGGSLTAAEGEVVATGRRITVDDGGSGSTLTGLVQIDADVVSGDSGGAVLDADGEVVGMTTAASSGGVDIEGYAVPVARVLRIVEAVTAGEETGSIDLGYAAFLGVTLDPSSGGTTIAGVVAGSAADGLGLSAGATITSVDGEEVATAEELTAAVTAHEVGDEVEVAWTDVEGEAHSGSGVLTRAPVG